MAITFVAAATPIDSFGNAGATPTLPSHQADDYILVYCYANNNSALATEWTETSSEGYTRIFNQADTLGRDRLAAAFYKKAASGAENDPTFDWDTANNADFGALCIVLRGAHTTTFLDVTYSEPSHHTDHENTGNPTNDAITTNTDGAWVLLLMNASHGEHTAMGAPSGYTLRTSDTGNETNAGISTKEVTSAGTETPGAWTNTGTFTDADASTFTLAVKPAAAATSPNNVIIQSMQIAGF